MVNHPCYSELVYTPQGQHKLTAWVRQLYGDGSIPKTVNAVAGCGQSGIIAASAIGYDMLWPVIAVRKPDESAHSYRGQACMNVPNALQYIIVDDLIASGQTIIRIIEAVEDAHSAVLPVAILLYYGKPDDNYFSWIDHKIPILWRGL